MYKQADDVLTKHDTFYRKLFACGPHISWGFENFLREKSSRLPPTMEGKPMSRHYKPKTFTRDYFEYEKHGTDISVVGRLREHISFWESIGASDYILDVIRRGYVIPLKGEIETALYRNNKSSREEPSFVQSAIDDLLATGAIRESATPPFVVNPLTVASKGLKPRLVIDLRHLNKNLIHTKCKFEGIETAVQFLQLGGYMTTFDLKNGYHHLEIVESQQQLLGFAYPDWQGEIRFFYFRVLPFGLATAGQIFTKVLRQLIRYWRQSAVLATVFLDDGLQCDLQEAVTRQHALQVKGNLLSAGWIPNRKKSTWTPVQVVTWLGFVLDLLKGIIYCTEDRLAKTMSLLTKLLAKDVCHIKELAKLNGILISLEKSHGEIVYLMTRFLSLAIAEAPTWDSDINLNDEIKNEIKFWVKNLRKINGRAMFPSTAVSQVLYSDASGTGVATVLTGSPNRDKYIVNRMFNADEAGTSSTERELLGVLHGLIEFKHLLLGQSVLWNTDSKNVARKVKRGSMKVYLLNIAVAIFHITRKYRINLNVVWIPRAQNEEADFWSRVRDFNDWGIEPVWFVKICAHCKVNPIVDRFADFRNKKTKRYNSRFYHSTSEAVDAFSQNWAGVVNWVVPPLYLVNRAVDYARICQAEIVLVVPLWRSAVFWPKLLGIMQRECHLIRHKMILGDIFERGTTPSAIFGSSAWRGSSLVLHLMFNVNNTLVMNIRFSLENLDEGPHVK